MIVILLSACVVGPGVADVVPSLDHGFFVDEVQPVLEASCANPSCHGTPRPLEVYASGLHRLDPERAWLREPLSDEELWRNHLRAACFVDPEDPELSPLLRKPLAGGPSHVGGDIWKDDADPAYQAVRAWVLGASAPPDTAPSW